MNTKEIKRNEVLQVLLELLTNRESVKTESDTNTHSQAIIKAIRLNGNHNSK